MATTIKKSFTQELRNYLYSILASYYVTNEEDMITINNIFNLIDETVATSTNEYSFYETEIKRLSIALSNQIKVNAPEKERNATVKELEAIQKKQRDLNSKITDIEIPTAEYSFISNMLRNFMKTKFANEENKSE